MAGKYILHQNGARIQSILDFFEGYTFTTTNFPQYCSNLINANGTVGGDKTYTGNVVFNNQAQFKGSIKLTSSYSDNYNSFLWTTFSGSPDSGDPVFVIGLGGINRFYTFRTEGFLSSNKDLGMSGYLWKDIWFSGALKDDTNSITVSQIVNDKANKIDVLPSFTVATFDNIYDFYTENNLEGKSFILNMTNFYRGVTGFLQAGQPGTPHISFTFILHDGTTIYQGSNVEAENLTFSDAFNDIYKKETELKNNKVTSLSSDSTDNQYPSAKAVYDFVEPLVEITWSDLKTLRDSAQLSPGKFYRITDYTCTTVLANTSSAGHYFDIVVQAVSSNQLKEEVSIVLHAEDTYFANSDLKAWRAWYSLDNDNDRFAWADTNGIVVNNTIYTRNAYFDSPSGAHPYAWKNGENSVFTNISNPEVDSKAYSKSISDQYTIEYTITALHEESGKGVIYRLIDEFGNDCPYDFKNILFTKSGKYTNAYTFTQVDSGVKYDSSIVQDKKARVFNNIIKNYREHTGTSTFIQLLNFNVFYYEGNQSVSGLASYNNLILEDCHDNTFSRTNYNNILKQRCYNNSFTGNCDGVKIGYKCHDISFKNACHYNILGPLCAYITFSDTCRSNRFGTYCMHITLGDGTTGSKYIDRNIFEGNNEYLTLTWSNTGSTSLQNVCIHQGVKGTSSAPKTISVTRGLNYQTDVFSEGATVILI